MPVQEFHPIVRVADAKVEGEQLALSVAGAYVEVFAGPPFFEEYDLEFASSKFLFEVGIDGSEPTVIVAEIEDEVVGFIWGFGGLEKPRLVEKVQDSTVLGSKEEKHEEIKQTVGEMLDRVQDVEFKQIEYIAELGVVEDYQGTLLSFKIMALMTKIAMEKKKMTHYLFWTTKESKMYGIMEKNLGGHELGELPDGKVLMMGEYAVAWESLERFLI